MAGCELFRVRGRGHTVAEAEADIRYTIKQHPWMGEIVGRTQFQWWNGSMLAEVDVQLPTHPNQGDYVNAYTDAMGDYAMEREYLG